MTRRFRQTMKGSFFGDFVYSQVIPADHFLMQLDKTINIDCLTRASPLTQTPTPSLTCQVSTRRRICGLGPRRARQPFPGRAPKRCATLHAIAGPGPPRHSRLSCHS